VTIAVSVAVIANLNATANPHVAKSCTTCGMGIDCTLLLCLLQCEFPRRDTVAVPQREEETAQAVVSCVVFEFPGEDDSHSTGVKPPSTWASVSKMSGKVFA
jgi:hypothetical protein